MGTTTGDSSPLSWCGSLCVAGSPLIEGVALSLSLGCRVGLGHGPAPRPMWPLRPSSLGVRCSAVADFVVAVSSASVSYEGGRVATGASPFGVVLQGFLQTWRDRRPTGGALGLGSLAITGLSCRRKLHFGWRAPGFHCGQGKRGRGGNLPRFSKDVVSSWGVLRVVGDGAVPADID